MIICFVCVEFEEFFIDLGYQTFVYSVICEYLLPFCGLPLCFVDCFLCCAEAFDLNEDGKQHVLERMWRKGNPLTLLVGMQVGVTTLENSVEIP